MEKIWIIIGVIIVIVALLILIQQMIYNGQYRIQQECKNIETANTIRIINTEKTKVKALENETRCLRLQLESYRNWHLKLIQEEINKEEPIQGIYCRECKNNVGNIACKASVKCKRFE